MPRFILPRKMTLLLSLTRSQIGGDPTTVRNDAMNAVTFAGGSASALSA
jgi:hypothetical protein